eukprot:c724_g2_i1 orf=114-314(-)
MLLNLQSAIGFFNGNNSHNSVSLLSIERRINSTESFMEFMDSQYKRTNLQESTIDFFCLGGRLSGL